MLPSALSRWYVANLRPMKMMRRGETEGGSAPAHIRQ